MKYYGRMAGEGFSLILAPILVAIYVALLLIALPFFFLGLLKRGVIVAFTHGDPRVP